MKFLHVLYAVVSAVIAIAALEVEAGPFAAAAAYGTCQSGCNALAVACYAAGGAVFGTVTAGTGIPAMIAGCNLSLGTCMAACAAATVAAAATPTP